MHYVVYFWDLLMDLAMEAEEIKIVEYLVDYQ